MTEVLCIAKVQRDINKEENFTKDKIYPVWDIDSDYNNDKSLQLEVLNNQKIPHIISSILADTHKVKDEDWYNDTFFKEHFQFVKPQEKGDAV